MRLPVLIENDIRGLDIEIMRVRMRSPGRRMPQRSRSAIDVRSFFKIRLLAGLVRDLDVHRTRSLGRDGFRKVHGKADPRKDKLAFGKIDPVLVADVRAIDSDVDVQDANRPKH